MAWLTSPQGFGGAYKYTQIASTTTTPMATRAYSGLEMNMTESASTAPARAVRHENLRKCGLKLGAPETRSAKQAMFKEKYTSRNSSEISAETVLRSPRKRQPCPMAQDRTRATNGRR